VSASLSSPVAGAAAVAATGIVILPAPPIESVAAEPELQPVSPYERAALLLEWLHAIAPQITAELVEVLGTCNKRQLMVLFGMNSTEVAPEPDPSLSAGAVAARSICWAAGAGSRAVELAMERSW
jgi:hypothetical protein